MLIRTAECWILAVSTSICLIYMYILFIMSFCLSVFCIHYSRERKSCHTRIIYCFECYKMMLSNRAISDLHYYCNILHREIWKHPLSCTVVEQNNIYIYQGENNHFKKSRKVVILDRPTAFIFSCYHDEHDRFCW